MIYEISYDSWKSFDRDNTVPFDNHLRFISFLTRRSELSKKSIQESLRLW